MTLREFLFLIVGAQLSICIFVFIRFYHNRPSKVLPPPKETELFYPGSDREFIHCEWDGDIYSYVRAMEDLERSIDEHGIIRDESENEP